jgi:hypothetical protein
MAKKAREWWLVMGRSGTVCGEESTGPFATEEEARRFADENPIRSSVPSRNGRRWHVVRDPERPDPDVR